MSWRMAVCPTCHRRVRVPGREVLVWCHRCAAARIVTEQDGKPALRVPYRWSENPAEYRAARRRRGG